MKCHKGNRGSRGGLPPTQPLHTLGCYLQVEQCAVLLYSLSAGQPGPVFSTYIPLSSGATPECPLSNSVPKSKNPEFLLPPLRILTCVQRADLFKHESL